MGQLTLLGAGVPLSGGAPPAVDGVLLWDASADSYLTWDATPTDYLLWA